MSPIAGATQGREKNQPKFAFQLCSRAPGASCSVDRVLATSSLRGAMVHRASFYGRGILDSKPGRNDLGDVHRCRRSDHGIAIQHDHAGVPIITQHSVWAASEGLTFPSDRLERQPVCLNLLELRLLKPVQINTTTGGTAFARTSSPASFPD
jgi:hypothetical protein